MELKYHLKNALAISGLSCDDISPSVCEFMLLEIKKEVKIAHFVATATEETPYFKLNSQYMLH